MREKVWLFIGVAFVVLLLLVIAYFWFFGLTGGELRQVTAIP